MRKLLLGTAALVAFALPASAASIQFLVSQDGGATTTLNTGQATAAAGPFNTPDFRVTATGSTQPDLSSPFLIQGQNISFTNPSGTVGDPTTHHFLDLVINALGLTGPNGLSVLVSGFDVTGISAGWSVLEETDINGTIVGSHLFTGPLSGGSDTDFLGFNLPNLYNASVHFHVDNGSVVGAANTGIALAAVAVPGPVVGAGLPGILAMFGAGGWFWRRRKVVG